LVFGDACKLASELTKAEITGWRQDSTDGAQRVAGINSHEIFVFIVYMAFGIWSLQ
jgi:hypothetical protein